MILYVQVRIVRACAHEGDSEEALRSKSMFVEEALCGELGLSKRKPPV